jgi:flagellin-like hook-associated protein FlgL
MIGGVNTISSSLASIYSQGNQQLADTLTRISTGKKFQNAAEDIVGFSRANTLSQQISDYGDVKQNLTSAKTLTSAAAQVGSSVYEDLTKLQSYATKYAGASASEQAQYKAEFDALKTSISTTLTNSAVDGTSIATTGSKGVINLDPNGSTLDIDFSAAASAATIGAFNIANVGATDISNEVNSALTYLAEAKGYSKVIDNQISLNNTVVNSKEAVKSLITDIDDAAEMAKYNDQSVRQQAAISMISQANMSRQAVMRLFS